MSTQWGIIRVQTWEGLRVRNLDCASAELKQLGAREWGEGTISMKTGFIFWSMRVTHCGSPCTAWKSSKTCLCFVDTAQVDVRKCDHLHTRTRIYCIRVYKEMCVKVQEVHLLSDRPQQCDGCVGFWSITDVWQADELWHSHTLLPPHILPSSACLLISLGGGRKLPPFLPKRVFPSPLFFPPAPPILLCCVVLRWLRLWQVFREGNAEGEESNNLLN